MLAPDAFTECIRDALNHLYDPRVARALCSIVWGWRWRVLYTIPKTLIGPLMRSSRGLTCQRIAALGESTGSTAPLPSRWIRSRRPTSWASACASSAAIRGRPCRWPIVSTAKRASKATRRPLPGAAPWSTHHEEVSWLSEMGAAMAKALDAPWLLPLAASCDVEIASYRLSQMPPVNLAALKQAIISTASYIIASSAVGSLLLRKRRVPTTLTLTGPPGRIGIPPRGCRSPLCGAHHHSLLGGELHEGVGRPSVDLILPVAALVDVALIDDNQDFADLPTLCRGLAVPVAPC